MAAAAAAPLTFRVSFYGEHQIDRKLLRWREGVADLTPVWEVLAERFVRLERRQFSSQGVYSGGWQPLSPAYAAWKLRQVGPKPILQFTGALWRSLTRRPLGVESLEAHRMVIGSDVPYGRHHQHGGGHLPRRRPVELPLEERTEWVKLIQRYLTTGKTIV